MRYLDAIRAMKPSTPWERECARIRARWTGTGRYAHADAYRYQRLQKWQESAS